MNGIDGYYYDSTNPSPPDSISSTWLFNDGYLRAIVRSAASATLSGMATASADFEFLGVSSPQQPDFPGLSLEFDDGRTMLVQPPPLLKDNGPACDTPGSVQLGDPINIGTGNVYRSVEDYSTAGPDSLSFTRYYNTYTGPDTAASTSGERWRSTFDRYLRLNSPTSVTAERETGQVLDFTLVNGVWTSDSDMDYTLTQSGSTWTLTDPHDSIETYTAGSSGLGLLDNLQSRDGYTQTLAYNASHQLASVTDSFGRALSFTYQNGLLSSLTSPGGSVLVYGYGGSGAASDELTSVTYPTVPPSSQTYDYYPYGLLKDVFDQDGNPAASFSYDGRDRATSVFTGGDPTVDSVSVSYNDTDGSRTVTDANHLQTVYRFAMLQGVPKVTEINRQPSAGSWTSSRFTYDANGYVASSTDWNGNATTYLNDTHGQPTSITEAAGTPQQRTTAIDYHPAYHLPVRIVAPGLTTDFTYDAGGNLLTRTETDTTTQTVPYPTNGQQHVWTYSYDTLGHVLTADGPRTDVNDETDFTYNVTGYLSTVTDALGHVTSITSYDDRGLPLSMTDANGVVTTLDYDPMGRLLTRTVQTPAGDAVTRFSYDPAGLLTSLTQPDNSVLYYRYDTSSRLIGVSDLAGESIAYTLDGMGHIVRQDIRDSGGTIVKTQSQVFNELNQLVQSVGAIPTEVTAYAYDANGNAISITDASNHTTRQAFDALDRLITVTNPLNGITQYGYDTQDNMTSITSPPNLATTSVYNGPHPSRPPGQAPAIGLRTTYVYDGFGQVIQLSSPDTGTTTYRLDAAGNIVSQTDARGVVTDRTFDALNRVTGEIYPASPGENIAYAYDGTDGGSKGVGRLTGYSDETGVTSLAYDELGDVMATTHASGGEADTTAYAHNLAGNITQITYPSGRIVNYSYDSQGRIGGVTTRAGSDTAAVTLATGITYEPFGPLASLTFGNGLVLTRTFDADYRITGITARSDTASVQDLILGYDANGYVASIIDALTPDRSQTFTYDALDRLQTALGAYSTVGYTYDADSNRLTSTQGGATQTYGYSPTSNRLLSVTDSTGTRGITYTASGNIATESGSGRVTTYTYSNRNRLAQVSISGGSTASYLYNALGERLSKTVGGTVTQFHYDQSGQLIAESDGTTGAVNREYVWLGDLPLAQIESDGTVYTIHADQTNTPQKMTDASQTVVWDSVQQPFGDHVSTTGIASTDLRVPGQITDAESGLSYNFFRDYDPSLGRYIEADPIGLAGGVSLYGYVGQNPLNAIDSLGLCQESSDQSLQDDLIKNDVIESTISPFDFVAGGIATGLERLLAGGLRGLFADSGATALNSAINLSSEELLEKLAQIGVKYTPENIIAIGQDANKQIIFIESGNTRAGLQHIIETHGNDFAARGIAQAQISDAIMTAVTRGEIVGQVGSGANIRLVYEFEYNGLTQRVAIGRASNGFIVTAHPVILQ